MPQKRGIELRTLEATAYVHLSRILQGMKNTSGDDETSDLQEQ